MEEGAATASGRFVSSMVVGRLLVGFPGWLRTIRAEKADPLAAVYRSAGHSVLELDLSSSNERLDDNVIRVGRPFLSATPLFVLAWWLVDCCSNREWLVVMMKTSLEQTCTT